MTTYRPFFIFFSCADGTLTVLQVQVRAHTMTNTILYPVGQSTSPDPLVAKPDKVLPEFR
jgi:hypothetical protein